MRARDGLAELRLKRLVERVALGDAIEPDKRDGAIAFVCHDLVGQNELLQSVP